MQEISKSNTCAIIVTYHPELELIDRINHLCMFLDRIFVVDNSTSPNSKLLSDLKANTQVTLIENSANLGIATALNIGVRTGIHAGYEWFITLDQDTSFSQETFHKMTEVYTSYPHKEKIGLLAPVHFDATTGYQSSIFKKIKGNYTSKSIVMTSGNLIPKETFEKVGLYDDDLFIEYVDHDFCLRVKRARLHTILVKDARIGHSLGQVKIHRLGPFFFFSHNYQPVRRYYRARNRLILYKRYPGWWILQDHEFALKDIAKILLVETNKWDKIKANFVGSFDALQYRMGAYENRFNQSENSFLHLNSIYNLLGNALPLIVGFLTIPYLIEALGLEKFGFLTLIWAIIGYFSIFDFGLSRTITVKLAQLSARKKHDEMNLTFWTSIKFIFLITLVGSAAMFIASFQTGFFEKRFSPELIHEGVLSIKIMALTLPAITLAAGIKGALEAEHRFFQLNIAQSALGTLNFLIPTLIAIQNDSLHVIVGALAILRYIFLGVHFLMLKKTTWLQSMKFQKIKESWPLFMSGGWFTVTNIIGPVFVYLDRFVLAFLIPPAVLAYYTTSSEIVNRLQIFPFSISRAVFPSLASADDQKNLNSLYMKAFGLIALLCGSIAMIGLMFGKWGLSVWLSPEFAEEAFSVFSILLFGFFMNALAWSPFSLIQALHRPDLSAKIHLAELPIYCVVLYFLSKYFGIVGAAWAWTFRTSLDFFLMTIVANRLKRRV